jgi:UDP-glucose 4-epimerase
MDAIVYLAAQKNAGASMLEPVQYTRSNIQATLSFLDAAIDCGVKHVVFSSSAATYGEPVYLPIDEDHPKDPTNYYGFTKLEIGTGPVLVRQASWACVRRACATSTPPATTRPGTDRRDWNATRPT